MWTDDIRDAVYRERLDGIMATLPEGLRPA